MLVYVNGQLLDSKKDDLIFLGFEENEMNALLTNLNNNVNTFAMYEKSKHKEADIKLILQIIKKTLEERQNKVEMEK